MPIVVLADEVDVGRDGWHTGPPVGRLLRATESVVALVPEIIANKSTDAVARRVQEIVSKIGGEIADAAPALITECV
ncbi:hypothetical protein [Mesorhizobium sp.]|uniref:hypothetical protein n=1 Tax=Mesorhizobium sp. TaxID=1871066 RepID=UPI000FE90A93|nr:hypothetical protein [Mesorhizobium sp.]RWP42571.1 MAG: hypothetical protein EOR05_29030 [Mesorhizobium sp.]